MAGLCVGMSNLCKWYCVAHLIFPLSTVSKRLSMLPCEHESLPLTSAQGSTGESFTSFLKKNFLEPYYVLSLYIHISYPNKGQAV